MIQHHGHRMIFLMLTRPLLLMFSVFGMCSWASGAQQAAADKPFLDQWLGAAKDMDPTVRANAARALGHVPNLSESTVPTLITLAGDADFGVRLAAAGAIAEIGPAARGAVPALIAMLKETWSPSTTLGYQIHAKAAVALGAIGPEARDSIPELIRLLVADTSSPSIFAKPIAQIGPTALAPLIDLFTSEGTKPGEPDGRNNIAIALKAMGPAAAPAVPALIKALNHPNPRVRQHVPDILGNGGVGAAGKAAIPALIKALADPDEFVRARVEIALGSFGPDAESAIPALIEASRGVKGRPTMPGSALGRIGQVAVPRLISALSNEDATIRRVAVEALGNIKDPNSVNALILALGDKDDGVRLEAVFALPNLGPVAAHAIPNLVEELKTWPEGDQHIRRALVAIGQSAVSRIVNDLGREGPKTRNRFLDTLATLDDPADVTSPAPGPDDVPVQIGGTRGRRVVVRPEPRAREISPRGAGHPPKRARDSGKIASIGLPLGVLLFGVMMLSLESFVQFRKGGSLGHRLIQGRRTDVRNHRGNVPGRRRL